MYAPILYGLMKRMNPERLAHKILILLEKWKTHLRWLKDAYKDLSERRIDLADRTLFRKKVAELKDDREKKHLGGRTCRTLRLEKLWRECKRKLCKPENE